MQNNYTSYELIHFSLLYLWYSWLINTFYDKFSSSTAETSIVTKLVNFPENPKKKKWPGSVPRSHYFGFKTGSIYIQAKDIYKLYMLIIT